MIWQDRPSAGQSELDAEQELELRLSAQARAGAAWALSALVARYQPPVVRYLVRLTGNQQTAYALAEQIFVRMGRRLRGPQGGRQLRLWLLRAATDGGLDAIRTPATKRRGRLLTGGGPAGLLPAVVSEPRVSRVLTSLGVKPSAPATERKGAATQEFIWQTEAEEVEEAVGNEEGRRAETGITPEQVRVRLLRAVLAELPYADAQCLALHLVAGLNQSDVAQALGVADVVVRRRIVQGLEVFGGRYSATLERLGLREEDDAASADADTLADAPADLSPESVVDAPPIIAAASALPAGDAVATTPAADAAASIGLLDEPTEQPAPAGMAADADRVDEAVADTLADDATTWPNDVLLATTVIPDAVESPVERVGEAVDEPTAALVASVPDDLEDLPMLAHGAEEEADAELEAAGAPDAAEPETIMLLPPVHPTAADEHDERLTVAREASAEAEETPAVPRQAPVTWRIVDLERDLERLATGGDIVDDAGTVSSGADGAFSSQENLPAAFAAVAVAPPEGSDEEGDALPIAHQTEDLTESLEDGAIFPVARAAAAMTRPLAAEAPTADDDERADDEVPIAGVESGLPLPPTSEPTPTADRASPDALAERYPLTARIRRVLSADGEAEDPGDDSLWPVG